MSAPDLKSTLDKHAAWTRGDAGGERANLSAANLSDANLSGAYLRGANLSAADLRDANLSGAYLRGANLSDAYLRNANLSGAYLRGADLSDAYLRGANLSAADLRNAYLRNAYLRDAYLSDANLSGALICYDGRKWEEYVRDPLAGLCDSPEARKRAVAAWGKHSWGTCPMSAANGWKSNDDAADKAGLCAFFVATFDAKLLSEPTVEEARA